MGEDLASYLAAIEVKQIPAEEKISRYHDTFEYWRQRNDLLESGLRGDLSLVREWDRLRDKYGGANGYVPRKIDDSDKVRVAEFENLAGTLLLEDAVGIGANPVFAGAFFGMVSLATILASNPTLNRRALLAGFGAGFGAAVGGGLSYIRNLYFDNTTMLIESIELKAQLAYKS